MASDYQCQKSNPFYLESSLYRRVLAVIRDYPRQQNEVISILYDTPEKEVSVRSSNSARPTEGMALRLALNRNDLEAVTGALEALPEEYQDGVFKNVVYGERFPKTASYRTWLRQKQRFIYQVARNLNLIM